MDWKHVTHAGSVVRIEIGETFGFAASIEWLVHFDAEHNRELSTFDGAPCLLRRKHDTIPTLARPAALGVDIGLHEHCLMQLQVDRLAIRAGLGDAVGMFTEMLIVDR